MRRPLEIESEVEFVLVGPILNQDGVILKSKNIGIDLIGMAYNEYRKEPRNNNLQSETKAAMLWSKDFPLGARRMRLLFCYRHKGALNIKIISALEDALDEFIENSFTVIKGYTTANGLNNTHYTNWPPLVYWHIAPFLLKCKYPQFI